MTLFLDYQVQLPSEDVPVCSAWCEVESVLAVALKSNEVRFYGDEGYSRIDAVHKRSARICKMEWQPNGKTLAIGWNDGGISFWNMTDASTRLVVSPHRTAIGLLVWAPYGNRLITSDHDGLLVVWKIDARGYVNQCAQYRRPGIMTQCTFSTSPQQRERIKRSSGSISNLCPAFFFGGELGSVHFADDLGHITDVQSLNTPIEFMLFYEEKNRLIIITKSMLLMQLQVEQNGRIKPIMKVKLSISNEGQLNNVLWAGEGLLAIATGEALIRFFDLSKDENYVLNLSSAGPSMTRTDRITTISFNPRTRAVAAGTREGNVVFWKSSSASGTAWEFTACTALKQSIERLSWGPFQYLATAEMDNGIFILSQIQMHRSICQDAAAIQSGTKCISVERHVQGEVTQALVDSTIRIKNLVQDGANILVHNGMKAEVYEMERQSAILVSEFITDQDPVGIRGDTIFRFVGCELQFCNLKGKVKHTISFTEGEGRPILLDINGKFIAVGTDKGTIKVFELSRRDPRLVGSPGKFNDTTIQGLENCVLQSIKCNMQGTRVSILSDMEEGALGVRTPTCSIYLYNVDDCSFSSHSFGAGRHPISHFWDPEEPRIVVCETHRDNSSAQPETPVDPAQDEEDTIQTKSSTSLNIKATSGTADQEVTTFFATLERGLQMQDTFEMDSTHQCLLGVHVPYLFFAAKSDQPDSDSPPPLLRPIVMRDFVGLDKVDDDVKTALVDFSYYITIGNMDEAYRSVKLIQNPSVWENMANMCVKTGRLDVAEVCLGNMGHARGARALKDAKQEPEKEVAVAMVAIQLGLLDDAARLYRECNRFDLLNKLYRSAGYWGKSLEIAEDKDRIHLKSSHFIYAKYLESTGDYQAAIKHFEAADLHHKEVPRMMCNRRKLNELEDYIEETQDERLFVWWARYLESNGDYGPALKYYRRAKDTLSIVRVHCFNQDFESAVNLVESSGSKVGAYQLARQFEAAGSIKDAIHFYAVAKCFNHAIRLSKEHEFDSDLMNFALQSSKRQMIDCALYFQQKNELDKAVQLYQKGGDLSRALDLCFKGQLYDVLHHIADDLSVDTSPAIINQCTDFFMTNGHYEKAVALLITGQRFNEAIDVCSEHNVKISEEMAEKLTLPPSDRPSEKEKRLNLLRKLAKCLRQQGSYHLATKKYTQAGDKLKAMKCLLKSGDTEKVIFFAGVSRNKEIYILAANYLQNLDWHENPEILKSILSFYSKAKAFERLSSFYEACAQSEIDEYSDYDKALSALKEAMKFMSKSKELDSEERVNDIQHRVYIVEQFLSARQKGKSNPEEMIAMLNQLLEQPKVQQAIRVGDVYALLVEYYYSIENMDQAYDLIEKMKRERVSVKTYLNAEMLSIILQRVGGTSIADEKEQDDDDDDDDIDEDIDAEYKD